MLYFFSGTDRDKARSAMRVAAEKVAGKNGVVVRITDANTVADLEAALRGSGMFGEKRVVMLEGVFSNEEMRGVLLKELEHITESEEKIFLYEEKIDAATRKNIEKHAEKTEKFEGEKGGKWAKGGNEVFELASALRKGDKKALWVDYQRALAREEAPEAIHGILFWGAKQAVLSSHGAELIRSRKLVADLAELPHEARRKGAELEYALEKYILSINKV